MDVGESISFWITKLKQGDADAAQELWERYYIRLAALARKKLQGSPRSAKDEDDVVQSAFKSFCTRAKKGEFPDLKDRDNLWPLLVVITSRKATNQQVHELRAKRGGGRVRNQSPFGDEDRSGFFEVIANVPSPEEAAVFLDELERIMNSLDDPTHRLILLWKLEERTNSEIAQLLDCSLSGVERKLRLIRKTLLKEAAKYTPHID